MAITIIKEGKKENYKFTVVCPICGCEFEYELCDLKKQYDYSAILTSYPPRYRYTRYIECPCCHNEIVHDYGSDSGDGRGPDVVYTSNETFDWPDCATCPNRPDPNKSVVGDTPCNWCSKKLPKCIF